MSDGNHKRIFDDEKSLDFKSDPRIHNAKNFKLVIHKSEDLYQDRKSRSSIALAKLFKVLTTLGFLAIAAYAFIAFDLQDKLSTLDFSHMKDVVQLVKNNPAITEAFKQFENEAQPSAGTETKKVIPIKKVEAAPVKNFVYQPETYTSFGTLNLQSVPQENQILINGALVVDSSGNSVQLPTNQLQLPPGNYTIELKNTVLHRHAIKNISLKKDQELRVEYILSDH